MAGFYHLEEKTREKASYCRGPCRVRHYSSGLQQEPRRRSTWDRRFLQALERGDSERHQARRYGIRESELGTRQELPRIGATRGQGPRQSSSECRSQSGERRRIAGCEREGPPSG